MPMPPITKRVTRLSDGRELIYFDDADTTLPSRAGRADARPPDPRPAAARAAAGPADRGMDLDRGGTAGPGVPAACRPGSPRPVGTGNLTEIPDDYDVAVFENKSPSFGPGLPAGRDRPGPGRRHRTRPVRAGIRPVRSGLLRPAAHRVVGRFQRLPRPHGRRGVGRPHRRTVRLPGVRQVYVFENRGPGDRRHPAPPARPDLRLPLRHPADQEPAGLDRLLRPGPDGATSWPTSRSPSGC